MTEQLNMFDFLNEKYKINKPIRLIELFGGIGSQAKALENLKADFTHYKLVEFDKYPVASYNAIHGTNFAPTDITKINGRDLEIVDTDKYCYILTYSFPCQDLSLAGLGAGMKKGSGTRSGLLWEVERLLNECSDNLPQVLLMENVSQVISKKNKPDFDLWLRFLEEKGYSNYYQILNAKDFGIPQNRKRCFMISLLGNCSYTFPKGEKLKLCLKDMLEEEVDEKFYLSEKMIKYISATGTEGFSNHDSKINLDIARPITTDPNKRAGTTNYFSKELPNNFDLSVVNLKRGYSCKVDSETEEVDTKSGVGVIGNYSKSNFGQTPILNKNGIAPTVTENHGQVPAVKIAFNLYDMGYKGFNRNSGEVYEVDGACNTIQTMQGGNRQPKVLVEGSPFRIRRLTPLETWRLMGFSDTDFDKASQVNSNTQLYKQAGNSIVVNVLMAIFKELL